MEDKKKKGLAIIYDPHNLYQFIWYYCNKGRKKEWDALCLPNGYKGEYMHVYCEKSELFEKIFKSNVDYSNMSIQKKIAIFMRMIFYCVAGRQKILCKKILNQFVNVALYDEIVIIAEVGVVSGACALLGDEKRVIILEDGDNDYLERKRNLPFDKMKSMYYWQGYVLSKMGYCNPGWFYLKSSRNCIKYSSQPEKMLYREYKEIRPLFQSTGTDWELFSMVIEKVYPEIKDYSLDKAEVLILSRPLEDFVKNDSHYRAKVEEYVSKNYKSVLLKRHPREKGTYRFDECVEVEEIDNTIPVEALMGLLRGKEILTITPSATMMYMKAYEQKCTCIYFDGLYEESAQSNCRDKPLTYLETEKYCQNFLGNDYNIVVLY